MSEVLSFAGTVAGHVVFIFLIQSAVVDFVRHKFYRHRWIDAVGYSIFYAIFIDFVHFEWALLKAFFS